jgi:hypothetical protein
MAWDVPALLSQTQNQLEDLFKQAESGPIPNGPAKGTAIIAPGTVFSHELAELVSMFVWQGKTFDGPRFACSRRSSIWAECIGTTNRPSTSRCSSNNRGARLTPPSRFMVVAPIAAGQAPALRDLVAQMNAGTGWVEPYNAIMPLGTFDRIPLVRFAIGTT